MPVAKAKKKVTRLFAKVVARKAEVDSPEAELLVLVVVQAFRDSLESKFPDARRFFTDGRSDFFAAALGIRPELLGELVRDGQRAVRDGLPDAPERAMLDEFAKAA